MSFSIKNNAGILSLIFIHLLWFIFPAVNGIEWMNLSPLFLVVCCFVLGLYHKGIDSRFVTYTGIVCVASVVLYAVGVNTGRIFGSFFFGQALGVMVLDTPLIIGILWLLLSYTSSVTVSGFTKKVRVLNKPIINALLASVIVLIVDLLLEQIASRSDFWYWKNQETPLQNYTAWFVFAFAFNFLFQQLEIESENKTARWFMPLFLLLLIGLNLLAS
jgi:putative membrane protein